MRTLFFILFFVLGFCHIQARGQKPAHVIITAGQSNTDGRVPNNRLPDYIKAMAVDSTYTAGAYKYCHIAHNRTDGMFVPFWPLSHPKVSLIRGDMMRLLIIGWNSCFRKIFMLSSGLSVALP